MQWRWVWLGPAGEEAGHLGLVLDGRRTAVSAAVARPDQPLVVLREPDAPRPRSGLEVRASGLWADAVEEEPGDRWTIGLEAFALAVEQPDDPVGHRVPLGFDLEWERTGADDADRTPARVQGEVLVGESGLDVDAAGWWTGWAGAAAHQ